MKILILNYHVQTSDKINGLFKTFLDLHTLSTWIKVPTHFIAHVHVQTRGKMISCTDCGQKPSSTCSNTHHDLTRTLEGLKSKVWQSSWISFRVLLLEEFLFTFLLSLLLTKLFCWNASKDSSLDVNWLTSWPLGGFSALFEPLEEPFAGGVYVYQ